MVLPAIISGRWGLTDPDSAKAQRVMQAMLQMKKLDIAGLKKAAEQS